jgi:hypothetical protein
MHQGWPKFAQNLWFATPDNGLAALVYSPSEVTAKVAAGRRVKITEDTCYPMDDKIKLTVQILDDPQNEITFPLRLRIPGWCPSAALAINGKPAPAAPAGKIAEINRAWKNGDVLELTLPMTVATSTWYDNSVAIERGPLVYALRMSEQWTQKKVPAAEIPRYGEKFWEVTSPDKWNYGIIDFHGKDTAGQFKVEIDPARQREKFFWNVENAPIQIKARAREITTWHLYDEMAGPLPRSVWGGNPGEDKTQIPPETEITLIPYGCATLRISEFPVVR